MQLHCCVSPCSFLFKDQFIELTTSVPEDSDLYGAGESSLSGGLLLPRNGKVISAWSRDSAASEPDINTYSAQPFYLQLNKGTCSINIWNLHSQGPPLSERVLPTVNACWEVLCAHVDLQGASIGSDHNPGLINSIDG